MFWCNKCKTHKQKGEFFLDKNNCDGLSRHCKKCTSSENHKRYEMADKQRLNAKRAEYRRAHPEREKEKREIMKNLYPERIKAYAKKHRTKAIAELHDTYLVSNMKRSGIHISPETIELKRQQIRWLREIKQGKEELKNGNRGI